MFFCVCVKRITLFYCLCSWQLVFLILKVSQNGRSKRWVQLFLRYLCKNWYKNWYFHFHKTCDHQIWQAVISGGYDSNETSQVGADDVIKLRSRDKLKYFISTTKVPMATRLGRIVTYVDGLLPIKSHDHLVIRSWEITWQSKSIISSLPLCLWPPKFLKWWLTLRV